MEERRMERDDQDWGTFKTFLRTLVKVNEIEENRQMLISKVKKCVP